ncbi:MAG: helix-turn-helix transcriptional regulator [Tenericutes bacterium]|nr:helix-turn-helix transcriptional regulator [Mycoplasmatota bacterium]
MKVGVSLLDLLRIGKKLAELRQKKEHTQDDIAEMLFVSHQAVSKWERGISLPSIDNMCFLMKLYSVSLEELLCLDAIANDFDLDRLFQEHNRQYIIHEVILNKIKDIYLQDIIHLLSKEERLYAIFLLFDQNQSISGELWPRLSLEERHMIIHKYKEGHIQLDLCVLNQMMTMSEIKKIKEIKK